MKIFLKLYYRLYDVKAVINELKFIENNDGFINLLFFDTYLERK